MKILIIGLGSIALKHIKALRNLEHNLELYALRSNRISPDIKGVINIYSLNDVPQNLSFIIISNPTNKHFETINSVLQLKVPLFIEKPPLDSLEGSEELLHKIQESNIITYTAFNLRFHPVLQWLKKNIYKYKILEVNSYCGSYLPNWREGVDYRTNYSALKDLGGGVHLDLSHEIDYLIWLFGTPNGMKCSLAKISELEINSFDSARYILEYERMSIGVTLNYFRRDSKRDLEIITNDRTLHCDLLKNEIWDSTNKKLLLKLGSIDYLYTYKEQLKYFMSSIENGLPLMNTLEESLNTLKICINKL